MNIISDKASLLAAVPRRDEIVSVGGVDVRIVEIGAMEYQGISARVKDLDNANDAFIAELVAASVVDADGRTYLSVDDFKSMSRVAQFVLAGKAMHINGLLQIEDNEKNAGGEQPDGSPSDSPSI